MIRDLITESTSVSITITEAQLEAYSMNLINRAVEAFKGLNKEQEYYTPDETAIKLKVDKSTLWRWAKQNYLCPVKIGGKTFYRSNDINKIMEG